MRVDYVVSDILESCSTLSVCLLYFTFTFISDDLSWFSQSGLCSVYFGRDLPFPFTEDFLLILLFTITSVCDVFSSFLLRYILWSPFFIEPTKNLNVYQRYSLTLFVSHFSCHLSVLYTSTHTCMLKLVRSYNIITFLFFYTFQIFSTKCLLVIRIFMSHGPLRSYLQSIKSLRSHVKSKRLYPMK